MSRSREEQTTPMSRSREEQTTPMSRSREEQTAPMSRSREEQTTPMSRSREEQTAPMSRARTTSRTALSGGVLDTGIADDCAELRGLVADLGRRSFDAHGNRHLPERFDDELWRHLEQTGLARLTSTPGLDAGPVEAAIVLRGLARHAGAVPIAETDLLAGWLGNLADLDLPDGPLTVAISDCHAVSERVVGSALNVPWARNAAAIVLAVCGDDGTRVGVVADPDIEIDHNLAGEPRDRVRFDLPTSALRALPPSVGAELQRRGAWARCCQIVGVLDGAAELSLAHTTERVQFGRPLRAFQAVQHSLATMAGEIERGRAATNLAVTAATDYGYGAAQTGSAIAVAKVVLGHVVGTVSAISHQLHGAIGVTAEHPLWLFTMRARSWVEEYGSTGHHARALGRAILAADDPWDAIVALGY